MRRVVCLLCVGFVPAASQTNDWQVFFNGKDLTVKDGVLRV